MKKLLTIFLLSITLFTAKAQCSAGTVTALQNCFNAGAASNPISLTANIALGATTLTVPNSPAFTLYIESYDITGSSWAIGSGNPTINASVNAASTVFQFTKNNPHKITDINGVGSIRTAMSSVLAVELLDFRAKSTQKGNELTWATAAEVNNKGLSIERQNDNDWETLGFVAAKGKGSYAFTDERPLSISYYRLRQMDNDGLETVSKILTIKRDKSGEVKVFPSVTTGDIRVESPESIEAVEILNTLGQVVLSQKGDKVLVINMNHLTSGLYVVRVALGGAVVSKKVFKQ